MKRCPRCGLKKDQGDFYRNRATRDGLQCYCKACVNKANSITAPKYEERFRAYQRRRHVMRKFGLAWEAYLALEQYQGGFCAGCGQKETISTRGGKPSALAVDHDHATGFVRGLLCFACNTAIGALKHDPVLMRKLADYLERPAVVPTVDWAERGAVQVSRHPSGYRLSEEHKAKIAAAHLGKRGRKASAETRAKMSAAQKARHQTNGP